MIHRALLMFAAFLMMSGPVAAQVDGCWGLITSDWEWTVYRGDPGEPSYPPSESAVRFVPEVFRMTDSTVVPARSRSNPEWKRIEAVVPAPDPRPGYWQDRPEPLGIRVTWSEEGLFFEAYFPGFAPGLDSIVGSGYEEPNPQRTHHGVPGWRAVTTLVRRSCDVSGGL